MLTRAKQQQQRWMIKFEQVFNCVIPYVHDVDDLYKKDLETLATSLGKYLRVLKINKCDGLWEDGLVHVAKYCNQLRTLSLLECYISNDEHEKWLHELAIHNTVLETFHCRFKYLRYDQNSSTENSCTIDMKISPCSLTILGDAFRHAVRFEEFSGANNGKVEDYSGLTLPSNICCFGISNFHVTALKSLLPLTDQLKELNLKCMESGPNCVCFLIKKCPNLEVLYTKDRCGDTGMQVIGLFCKKLRKFTHAGFVTHMGLIVLAHGCINLEYINVRLLRYISNEAMECLGTHLKNLCSFSVESYWKTDVPLDNGIRAMLMGCNKLESLDIILGREKLTDAGLGYFGKYGHNLKYLSLECIGESDEGLVELSKGCLKLRTLRIKDCPFSEQAVSTFVSNMHSLRCICVMSGYHTVLALIRPDLEL